MTDTLLVPDVLPEPAPRAPGRGRQLVWILVLGLAGALLGLAIGARLEPQAHAEVSVALNPLPGNAFTANNGGVLVDLETESQLPSSDSVLRRMAADGEGATPGDDVLRRRLGVSVVPNTQVLVIRYRAENPQQAGEMAKRVAHAMLAERVARAKTANAQRAEVVQTRIDAITTKVGDLTKVAPSGENLDRVEQQIKLLSQENVALEAQLRAALTPVGSPGDVISSSTHGDALLKKVRLAILVGCIVVAMVFGAWVGRPPRRED